MKKDEIASETRKRTNQVSTPVDCRRGDSRVGRFGCPDEKKA